MAVDVRSGPNDGFLEYAMILDKDFMQIDLIDEFESFYWIDRYSLCGNFEIVMPVLVKHLFSLRIDNYVAVKESDRLMVIESVILNEDPEQGDKLTISGRTLESFLSRRIVWGKATGSGPIQWIIQNLLNQNAISPTDSKRVIPGLVFKSNDSPDLAKEAEDEITILGDNLYDIISELCESHNVGEKILLTEDNKLEYSLYLGTDRSWDQEATVPVVFSDSYENLLENNYIQTETEYISNALVRGDEDDVSMEVRRLNERTGLKRREMFIDVGLQPEEEEYTVRNPVVDENGNQQVDENGSPLYSESTEREKIYDMAYYNSLLAEAKIEMAKHKVTEALDATVDITHQFVYERDYFLGDIVQVENKYGYKGRCRITEVMKSRDSDGPKLVPTFVMINDDDSEPVKIS